MDRLVKEEFNFKDKCVRTALISLGWMPPDNSGKGDV
jgi:hypothetical protein